MAIVSQLAPIYTRAGVSNLHGLRAEPLAVIEDGAQHRGALFLMLRRCCCGNVIGLPAIRHPAGKT